VFVLALASTAAVEVMAVQVVASAASVACVLAAAVTNAL
jgi:hypothetical protein